MRSAAGRADSGRAAPAMPLPGTGADFSAGGRSQRARARGGFVVTAGQRKRVAATHEARK
jgi:hypothetical protein